MAGAVRGPFAAFASAFLILVALGLLMVRPVRMGRVLAVVASITASAIVIDTVRTGETLRLVGTASCVALAWWFAGLTRRVGMNG